MAYYLDSCVILPDKRLGSVSYLAGYEMPTAKSNSSPSNFRKLSVNSSAVFFSVRANDSLIQLSSVKKCASCD